MARGKNVTSSRSFANEKQSDREGGAAAGSVEATEGGESGKKGA